MKKDHPANERIKHKYFAYLKEAQSAQRTDGRCSGEALKRFEDYTQFAILKHSTLIRQ